MTTKNGIIMYIVIDSEHNKLDLSFCGIADILRTEQKRGGYATSFTILVICLLKSRNENWCNRVVVVVVLVALVVVVVVVSMVIWLKCYFVILLPDLLWLRKNKRVLFGE